MEETLVSIWIMLICILSLATRLANACVLLVLSKMAASTTQKLLLLLHVQQRLSPCIIEAFIASVITHHTLPSFRIGRKWRTQKTIDHW